MKYYLLPLVGMLALVMVLPSVSAYSGFSDDCSSINQTAWKSSFAMPTVSSGAWVFSFLAGQAATKQLEQKFLSGYGTYTVVMKMSQRVAGCNAWVFVYQGSPWQELDFMEVWGRNSPSASLDVALYVNGLQTLPGYGYGGGIGYWFPNVYQRTGVTFDDNQWHTWTFVWTDGDLVEYLDGHQFFQWSTECTDPDALGLPPDGLTFMVGGKGDGSQSSGFTMMVDSVKYEPISVIPAPSPEPEPTPTDPTPEPDHEPDNTPEPSPVIPPTTPTVPTTPLIDERDGSTYVPPSGGGSTDTGSGSFNWNGNFSNGGTTINNEANDTSPLSGGSESIADSFRIPYGEFGVFALLCSVIGTVLVIRQETSVSPSAPMVIVAAFGWLGVWAWFGVLPWAMFIVVGGMAAMYMFFSMRRGI